MKLSTADRTVLRRMVDAHGLCVVAAALADEAVFLARHGQEPSSGAGTEGHLHRRLVADLRAAVREYTDQQALVGYRSDHDSLWWAGWLAVTADLYGLRLHHEYLRALHEAGCPVVNDTVQEMIRQRWAAAREERSGWTEEQAIAHVRNALAVRPLQDPTREDLAWLFIEEGLEREANPAIASGWLYQHRARLGWLVQQLFPAFPVEPEEKSKR